MSKEREFTNYYDDNGQPIFVGDVLSCKWGYMVVVTKDGNVYYGRLICNDNHSCKDIPYDLNSGKGHVIIKHL